MVRLCRGPEAVSASYRALSPAVNRRTNPFAAQAVPDIWHCAYCGRENHGGRLACAGCRAGRPCGVEDAGLERGPQPRPPIHPVDTFGIRKAGGVLQRLKKMAGLR